MKTSNKGHNKIVSAIMLLVIALILSGFTVETINAGADNPPADGEEMPIIFDLEEDPVIIEETTEESTETTTVETTTETTTISWEDQIASGAAIVEYNDSTLVKKDLPSKFYPNVDFSTFRPYEDVSCISNKSAPAYYVCHHQSVYSDSYGLMRKPVESGFSIGQDDYIIALGNYYKNKGEVGNRFLIRTTTGYFTAVVGDEKADKDTDPYHMFAWHDKYAGMVEFVVNTNELPRAVTRMGSVSYCGDNVMNGDIIGIYEIQ